MNQLIARDDPRRPADCFGGHTDAMALDVRSGVFPIHKQGTNKMISEISRTMAGSVFDLMDARGITGTDVVVISLYNSGPTLHVEPECLLRAFAGDGLTYVERLGGLHALADVNGIRVVSMCITPEHIAKLRAVGKLQVPFVPAESSEVAL